MAWCMGMPPPSLDVGGIPFDLEAGSSPSGRSPSLALADNAAGRLNDSLHDGLYGCGVN